MPVKKKRKYDPMDDYLLLYTLLHSGRYHVDIEDGRLYSLKDNNGKDRPHGIVMAKHYAGVRVDPDKKHPFYQVQCNGHRVRVSVCKAVWMVSRKTVVPPDFEIHHLDLDSHNNHHHNLAALHELDHQLQHKLAGYQVLEEEPF